MEVTKIRVGLEKSNLFHILTGKTTSPNFDIFTQNHTEFVTLYKKNKPELLIA